MTTSDGSRGSCVDNSIFDAIKFAVDPCLSYPETY